MYLNELFDLFSVTPCLRMLGPRANVEALLLCPCLGTFTRWTFMCSVFRESEWVRKCRVFLGIAVFDTVKT